MKYRKVKLSAFAAPAVVSASAGTASAAGGGLCLLGLFKGLEYHKEIVDGGILHRLHDMAGVFGRKLDIGFVFADGYLADILFFKSGVFHDSARNMAGADIMVGADVDRQKYIGGIVLIAGGGGLAV